MYLCAVEIFILMLHYIYNDLSVQSSYELLMYVYTQSMAEVIIVFHYLIFLNSANTGAIQTKIKELCMKGSLKIPS